MTLKNLIEGARSLARPYLVYLFGAALVAAAFVDAGAYDRLKEPALAIVFWYFGTRSNAETK